MCGLFQFKTYVFHLNTQLLKFNYSTIAISTITFEDTVSFYNCSIKQAHAI